MAGKPAAFSGKTIHHFISSTLHMPTTGAPGKAGYNCLTGYGPVSQPALVPPAAGEGVGECSRVLSGFCGAIGMTVPTAVRSRVGFQHWALANRGDPSGDQAGGIITLMPHQ